MEEIFSIIYGRWLLLVCGYSVRKIQLFFRKLFIVKNEIKKGNDKSLKIAFNDDQNIIPGLSVILLLVAFFVYVVNK